MCDAANALFTKRANPHVMKGALIEQSAFVDTISSSRASNDSRVAPEYNAGFTGAQPPPPTHTRAHAPLKTLARVLSEEERAAVSEAQVSRLKTRA